MMIIESELKSFLSGLQKLEITPIYDPATPEAHLPIKLVMLSTGIQVIQEQLQEAQSNAVQRLNDPNLHTQWYIDYINQRVTSRQVFEFFQKSDEMPELPELTDDLGVRLTKEPYLLLSNLVHQIFMQVIVEKTYTNGSKPPEVPETIYGNQVLGWKLGTKKDAEAFELLRLGSDHFRLENQLKRDVEHLQEVVARVRRHRLIGFGGGIGMILLGFVVTAIARGAQTQALGAFNMLVANVVYMVGVIAVLVAIFILRPASAATRLQGKQKLRKQLDKLKPNLLKLKTSDHVAKYRLRLMDIEEGHETLNK